MMNENTENMYIHFFRTQENENEKIGNDLDIFFLYIRKYFYTNINNNHSRTQSTQKSNTNTTNLTQNHVRYMRFSFVNRNMAHKEHLTHIHKHTADNL